MNDEKVAQAVAQMLQRIGIQTTVVTMPASVYFGRANRLEFSLMFVGWGTDTGEPAERSRRCSRPTTATRGSAPRTAAGTRARKWTGSRPGLATVDDAKRKILQRRSRSR